MPRIAVDLDGVLAEYHGHGEQEGLGAPLPGAREFVEQLAEAGWVVIVCSRNHDPEDVAIWLSENQFRGVSAVAPAAAGAVDATVFLDDRALRFNGDFGPVLDLLLHSDPRPWWRRTASGAAH